MAAPTPSPMYTIQSWGYLVELYASWSHIFWAAEAEIGRTCGRLDARNLGNVRQSKDSSSRRPRTDKITWDLGFRISPRLKKDITDLNMLRQPRAATTAEFFSAYVIDWCPMGDDHPKTAMVPWRPLSSPTNAFSITCSRSITSYSLLESKRGATSSSG